MHLALWDQPPVDCLREAALKQGLLVECHSAGECARLLQENQVDVALLPTTVVLTSGDSLTILPDAAVSSWSYPFARIALRRRIDKITSVGFPESSFQEALMARIILQEHYGRVPAFVPRPAGDLRTAPDDACLLIGPARAGEDGFGTILDIGQEWYELAQYPMVWGLFVAQPDAATPVMARTIKSMMRQAERLAGNWSESPAFYVENLRLRLDDVAIASLTRIREYLYYFRVISEMEALPIFEPEEPDAGQTPWWAMPAGGHSS